MITRDQLKAEIDDVDYNNMEILHLIIQALQLKTNNEKPADNLNLSYENPLKGSIVFENDIISPIDEDWEANA